MAVEIGASRLLAPYFSSSQIVWTIIIGTIMIAMALGNLWGGKAADKNPDPTRLYIRLAIAALWIGLIPLVGKFVIAGIALVMALIVTQNYLVWAAFVSCAVLFVFPLMLLGTVTPSLVRYTMNNIDNAGRTVGIMEALNTIGSIIGTFTPTFITIPTIGTSLTFVVFASILLMLSLLYFISALKENHDKKKEHLKNVIKAAVCFVLIIASGFIAPLTGFAFWDSSLREDESIYNYLQVSETDTHVYLSTNVLIGIQSLCRKDGQMDRGFYYGYALVGPLMTDAVRRGEHLDVLILGTGSGTYATHCVSYFDDVTVEGVEIDQKIIDLAYSDFMMPEEVISHTEDGRAFIDRTDKKYDLILVDAYQDITIPFHMSSVEFFTSVKNHLTEGGVMVVNMNMQSDKPGSINQYLTETITHVFADGDAFSYQCPNGNRLLFVADHDRMKDNLVQSRSQFWNKPFYDYTFSIYNNAQPATKGDHILTDDKAPVELLGMRVIDDYIFEEINYYKQLFKEEGFKSLFEQITK
ncbi:MAG: fused MFS/spermidine synthase [Clostridia bacterium]|nr:fused MFS/spermidine synthase [Clostridia bacterium]